MSFTWSPTVIHTKYFFVKVVGKNYHDAQYRESLLRELNVGSMLTDHTIVQATDMFSTTKKDYFVFDLMRGGTLSDIIQQHNKLPDSYAGVVMHELLTALNYLHPLNIVDRDVRPKGIF